MTEGEFSSGCNREVSYLLRLGSGNPNLAINIRPATNRSVYTDIRAEVLRPRDLPLAQDGDRL